MATISIVLEEKRKNKEALCPISIYVRVGAKTKITTTHMKVPKENYFDGVCTGRWRIFNPEIDKIQ